MLQVQYVQGPQIAQVDDETSDSEETDVKSSVGHGSTTNQRSVRERVTRAQEDNVEQGLGDGSLTEGNTLTSESTQGATEISPAYNSRPESSTECPEQLPYPIQASPSESHLDQVDGATSAVRSPIEVTNQQNPHHALPEPRSLEPYITQTHNDIEDAAQPQGPLPSGLPRYNHPDAGILFGAPAQVHRPNHRGPLRADGVTTFNRPHVNAMFDARVQEREEHHSSSSSEEEESS